MYCTDCAEEGCSAGCLLTWKGRGATVPGCGEPSAGDSGAPKDEVGAVRGDSGAVADELASAFKMVPAGARWPLNKTEANYDRKKKQHNDESFQN